MSKYMVKLKPSQQGGQLFRHPVFKGTKRPLTDEQIEELLPKSIAGEQSAREALILGHMAMLKSTVGRYLKHWPLTRRFKDEMISAGLLTLTRVITNLQDDTLGDRPLGPYLLNHICKHLEIEIATLRGIAPAPVRTNQRRIKDGKSPIYGAIECDLNTAGVEERSCYYEAGFEEVDTMEIIDKLRIESHNCELLLDQEYWGLNDSEAAKRTGIPQQTVQWYRTKMLKRYRELTGDEKC